ncbi:MAG: ion channel [Acidimicrobiaceae bacterium]|nr:ion channel [Acidimicrobiaceae bacterium]
MASESSPPGRAWAPGRLGSYSRRAEPVMLVLAIASVPLFLLEHRHWLAAAAGWIVVAVFFADLVIRVVLVDGSRRSYLVRHWYDVAIVVLSVLPVARPLRALRALQLLRGVRAFIAAHKAATTMSRGWKSLHGKALIVSCVALSAAAVLAVYEAERAAGGSIDSAGDALWWAAATVTTVGYGDLSPGTPAARAAAVVLMVCGVSLFGLLTANVSAKFLKNDALLAYEQMAELFGGGRSCPNCGHTPSLHAGATATEAEGDGSGATAHEQSEPHPA